LEYRLRLAQDEDSEFVAKIFNHFVENTFSAYPSSPVDGSFLHRLKAMAAKLPLYVAENPDGAVIGFAGLCGHCILQTRYRAAPKQPFSSCPNTLAMVWEDRCWPNWKKMPVRLESTPSLEELRRIIRRASSSRESTGFQSAASFEEWDENLAKI
jgi:hypothetical protein